MGVPIGFQFSPGVPAPIDDRMIRDDITTIATGLLAAGMEAYNAVDNSGTGGFAVGYFQWDGSSWHPRPVGTGSGFISVTDFGAKNNFFAPLLHVASAVSTSTFTTQAAHGLVVGDHVTLTGLSDTGGLTNGTTYVVRTVPTSTTFTLKTVGGVTITLTGFDQSGALGTPIIVNNLPSNTHNAANLTANNAAFTAAWAAAKAAKKSLYIPAGDYAIRAGILATTNADAGIVGDGCGVTRLWCIDDPAYSGGTGVGTCVSQSMTTEAYWSGGQSVYKPPALSGFTIQGLYAGNDSVGLRVGPCVGGRWDVAVGGFSGTGGTVGTHVKGITGGIGILMQNAKNALGLNRWTEESSFGPSTSIGNCTYGLVVDKGPGAGSFGYNSFQHLFMGPGVGQTGILIANDAWLYNCDMVLKGNPGVGSTVFSLTASSITAWTSGTPYIDGDVVTYSGSKYVCLHAITGTTHPGAGGDTTNWQNIGDPITTSRLTGHVAISMESVGPDQWSSSTNYFIGDQAANGGVYYQCIVDRTATATAPASDATHWSVVPPCVTIAMDANSIWGTDGMINFLPFASAQLGPAIATGGAFFHDGTILMPGVAQNNADWHLLANAAMTSAGSSTTQSQFTVPGDETNALKSGRRIRWSESGIVKHGTIFSSTYAAPTTTVTLTVDGDNYMTVSPDIGSVSYTPIPETLNTHFLPTDTVNVIRQQSGITGLRSYTIAGNFRMERVRGTPTAPLPVQQFDVLGNFPFGGSVDTSATIYTGVVLRGRTTEAWSGSVGGSQFEVQATQAGQQGLSTVMSAGWKTLYAVTDTGGSGPFHDTLIGTIGVVGNTTTTPDSTAGSFVVGGGIAVYSDEASAGWDATHSKGRLAGLYGPGGGTGTAPVIGWILDSAGKFYVGATMGGAGFTVDALGNVTALSVTGLTGVLDLTVAASNTKNIITQGSTIASVRGYGGNMPIFRIERVTGTTAAPTILGTPGSFLGAFNFGGASVVSGTTATIYTGVSIRATTTEVWSGTAGGTKLELRVTPNTTQLIATAFTVGQDGTVISTNVGGGIPGITLLRDASVAVGNGVTLGGVTFTGAADATSTVAYPGAAIVAVTEQAFATAGTQSGARLTFQTSALGAGGALTTRGGFDSSGVFFIGTNTGRVFTVDALGNVTTTTSLSVGTTSTFTGVATFSAVPIVNAASGASGLIFLRDAGTAVLSTITLGTLTFQGAADGTHTVAYSGASISSVAEEAFATAGTHSGSRIVFATSAIGAGGTLTTRFGADSAGIFFTGQNGARVLSTDSTYGSVALVASYDVVDLANGLAVTHNAANVAGIGIYIAPVITYSTAAPGSTTVAWSSFVSAPTHQNGNAALRLTGIYYDFLATPTYKSDNTFAQTITTASIFRATPTLSPGGSTGTLTITTLQQFTASGFTVASNAAIGTLTQFNAGQITLTGTGTVTTRKGFAVAASTGSGLTNDIGIDITGTWNVGSALNYGIRNSGALLQNGDVVFAANMHFNNGTPVSPRSGWGTPTGTDSTPRATYVTTTVSLAVLAAYVKDIVTDLKAVGLFTT